MGAGGHHPAFLLLTADPPRRDGPASAPPPRPRQRRGERPRSDRRLFRSIGPPRGPRSIPAGPASESPAESYWQALQCFLGEGLRFADLDGRILRAADADPEIAVVLQDVEGADQGVAGPEGLVADAGHRLRLARLLLALLIPVAVKELLPALARPGRRTLFGIEPRHLQTDRIGMGGQGVEALRDHEAAGPALTALCVQNRLALHGLDLGGRDQLAGVEVSARERPPGREERRQQEEPGFHAHRTPSEGEKAGAGFLPLPNRTVQISGPGCCRLPATGLSRRAEPRTG